MLFDLLIFCDRELWFYYDSLDWWNLEVVKGDVFALATALMSQDEIFIQTPIRLCVIYNGYHPAFKHAFLK